MAHNPAPDSATPDASAGMPGPGAPPNADPLRKHDDMLGLMGAMLRTLPAIGASMLGVSAFLLIAGAAYYQALLDALHASFALDAVSYVAMIRTGGLNALVFLLATALVFTLTAGGVLSWRGLKGGLVFACVVWVPTFGAPLLWPVLAQGRTGYWLLLSATVAMAYVVGLSLTALVVWRPAPDKDRRWLFLVGGLMALVMLIAMPMIEGTRDATRVLSGNARQYHPDVCLKDDPDHTWRLVRSLGDSYLVLWPDASSVRLRLVSLDTITSILVTPAAQPGEGGPPVPACRR